jgi:FixJ family two-component response regulator
LESEIARMAKKPTNMAVDEFSSVRKVSKRLLRSAGFNIETFASAQDYFNFREAALPTCENRDEI